MTFLGRLARAISPVLPPLRRHLDEVATLRRRAPPADLDDAPLYVPPGHFYSPIPSLKDAAAEAAAQAPGGVVPELDLDVHGQLAWLDKLGQAHAAAGPLHHDRTRYYPDNGMFPPLDAAILRAVLATAQPRRIVEVGSGFSTAVLLDALEAQGAAPPALTCIDPHFDRLRSVLRPEDIDMIQLIEAPVQSAPLGLFDQLAAGDILFIDSTHVMKAGSDVAFEMFTVLPRLAPGVLVHFHDIFFPFVYPRQWAEENRAWNEAYALRALLQNNDRLKVRLFTDQLNLQHSASVDAAFPGLRQHGSGSLWLETTASRQSTGN